MYLINIKELFLQLVIIINSLLGIAEITSAQDKPFVVSLSPSNLQYSIAENKSVGPIECSAVCNPPCTYQWKFKGRNIARQSNILSLSNIQREAAGAYWCVARNGKWLKNSPMITVSITYGPLAVDLSPHTQRYSLIESTRNSLKNTITCSADCNPACTFQWSRDGTVTLTSAVLWLTDATPAIAGTYRCIARNSHGSKQSMPIIITVEFPPKRMSISPPDTSYNIAENTSLDIICSAVCEPACTYQWSLNKTKLRNTGAALNIAAIKQKQSGTFRCEAWNTHGKADIVIHVAIYVKDNTRDVILQKSQTVDDTFLYWVSLLVIGLVALLAGSCIGVWCILRKRHKQLTEPRTWAGSTHRNADRNSDGVYEELGQRSLPSVYGILNLNRNTEEQQEVR